jgi:hypothetical protein
MMIAAEKVCRFIHLPPTRTPSTTLEKRRGALSGGRFGSQEAAAGQR